MKKKKEYALAQLQVWQSLCRCPLCKQDVQVDDRGWCCANGHRYDITKKGYLNVVNHKVESDYDKAMLTSRRRVLQSAIYAPLIQKIQALVPNEAKWLLDAGCGEGTYMEKLAPAQALGVDLSKEGIQLATDYTDDMHGFMVGDLTNLPLHDHVLNVILNIFSPAQYQEFKRILKQDGIVIKVIPEANYLKELRTLWYADTDKEIYSNEKVYQRWQEELTTIYEERVTYTVDVPRELACDVLVMSPIHWGKELPNNDKISQLTIDAKILVGQWET